MATGPKRNEAPTEPLKRAIGLTVRAIAGHNDLEVGFAPGAALMWQVEQVSSITAWASG